MRLRYAGLVTFMPPFDMPPRLPLTRRGRRVVLRTVGGLALAALHVPAFARVLATAAADPPPTPRMTDGPFYPVAFDRNPTTSLIVGPLLTQARPLRLQGRVVDRANRPVAGARVEIWQCDAAQHYRHPSDNAGGTLDQGFAGFGWQEGDADGRYGFETIQPVAYPGRTPHIHVKVKRDGRTLLSSQVFMPDQDALNRADFLWRHLGRDQQPLALATLERGGDRPVAHFDIVVG
jgi:protocatechuate 3,4-dioxygenase beta subunit